MVDNFSILLSHGLLAFALWRLLGRPDLDQESGRWADAPEVTAPAPSKPKPKPWGARDA
ncbi:hypothetical protein [Flavisphingopyxis soli]|uniref:hypothetical protein n=1 Tax=Flavisphingopyxis soli TaxID=2601267 RepID=UPI001376426E|nr:hypothetical protein [Sphingorhabdus soli]